MKIVKIDEVNPKKINKSLKKGKASKAIRKSVSEIIDEVSQGDDRALLSYTKKFDKVDLTKKGIALDSKAIESAAKKVEKDFIKALKDAKKRIENFHEKQSNSSWLKTDRGEMIGQLAGPIESTGIYVPGGENGYPSTVLMSAIPARIAGVARIALVSPPLKDGEISKYTLAAAYECGIDEIYSVGGAQAIAALTYGTKSIKPVDIIVGPGNGYVTEAKRQVFGDVGIDMVAGPSEIVVIADIKANPNYIAADLLSQAEHDSDATAILITSSEVLARKVIDLVNKKADKISRKKEVKKSIENKGIVFISKDIDRIIKISNIIAPEHLVVLVEQPTRWLPFIKNAGAIFLGEDAVQSAGDYSFGPNHILPTGGSAKFTSPLSVETFQKMSNIVWLSNEALKNNASSAIELSKKEGFTAHTAAIDERLKK